MYARRPALFDPAKAAAAGAISFFLAIETARAGAALRQPFGPSEHNDALGAKGSGMRRVLTARQTSAVARAVPGPAASTPGGPSTTRVLANTATTGAVATPSALQFNVPLVGGGQLDGSTLAGRPIAFWFWAPT